MISALAAILLQPLTAAQGSFPAEKIALIQPADSPASVFSGVPLPLSEIHPEMLVQPPEDVPPTAAVPPEVAPFNTTSALILVKPSKPFTVSVVELRAEGRRNDREWLSLGLVAHSAATFDAWTTRHAITTAGAHEQDPLLKPFAGNASIYAAIQVGPALMDYLGRKMMYSRHGWVRRMWWAPQSASIVTSFFCGAHNLGVHPAAY
jgi:hypothetical protein